LTVARYVVESLRLAGAGTLFGVPGVGGVCEGALWAAVEQAGARSVCMGHEQAAAHAADGYGRASGRPGAVFLPSGPAALAALSALGEALVSSSPVVAIASTIPSRLVGKGKGELGELGPIGQRWDPLPAYEAVTRFVARAMRATDVPDLLARAIVEATAGRPGPVLVEIPPDILEAELDAAPSAPSPERRGPPMEVVADAATLLRLAARPVVWAGGGVLRSRASAELARLAEYLGAPVVTTFMGKGAISESHPLALGALVRFPAVQATIARADLLVAVGTRFGAVPTSRWRIDLPPQTIHVDIDRAAIGRNYPVRLPVVADARVALDAITDALEAGTGADRPERPDRPDRRDEVARLRKAAFDRAWREGPREMDLLRAIRDALPSDAVTVHDMTLVSAWAAPFFPASVPGTFHGPYSFGTPGFALPAALGVSCALPGCPVVAFADHRTLARHARELATAVRHGSPVTVVVFGDPVQGGEEPSSPLAAGPSPDLPRPDLQTLAAAYGVPWESAGGPEELEQALHAAIGAGRPRLIEVPGAWGPAPLAPSYA
jgi:acetolactate synthase-1/2/3 large subunit